MATLNTTNIKHASSSTNNIVLNADGSTTIPNLSVGPNRNLIINGAMQVNQRGNKTGISSGGSNFALDRWTLALNNGGTWSISQSTDTPDGFGNSLKLDCTTADTSLAADDYIFLRQKLEGQDCQAFAKGTSAAKQFAVSFYVKTNKSGLYTVELLDNDNNRVATKTFTVSDGNWNRYTLIFPADTTGAFANDNDNSLTFDIWLGAGSGYTSGTLNTSTWASKSNANRASSSNVNLADSTSNEFYLTGVQLEVGSVTDFEHRSYGQELALARRYYFGNVGNGLFGVGRTTNASTMWSIQFPTEMRVNPSMSLTSTTVTISEPNAANFNVTSATLSDAHGGKTSKAFYLNGTMSVSPGDNLFLTTNYLKFDAEL
tara:strand:- start:1495 stop:2613 length:1119 start_codon:yes stop_codon:yes gene_type:complete